MIAHWLAKFFPVSANPAVDSTSLVLFAEHRGPGSGPYHSGMILARALVSLGYSVEVVPLPNNHDGFKELAEIEPRITLSRTRSTKPSNNAILKILGYFLESYRISRSLRTRGRQPQAVFFSLLSPGRFVWPNFGNTRSIYLFRSFPQGQLHKLAGRVFGALLPRSATVVGVSEAIARELMKAWNLGARQVSMGVLRNCGKDIAAPDSPSKTSTTRQILMVGRFDDVKNPGEWFEVAFELLASEKDLRFAWVGDGKLREEYLSRVMDFGLADNFLLPGHVDDLGPWYDQSHIYLHLAKTEPMSNALVEALRFGLPVVASNTGGNPEAVREGYNGYLVEPSEVASTARKVKELLVAREIYEYFSANAFETYEKLFSRTVFEQNLGNLLSPPIDAREHRGKANQNSSQSFCDDSTLFGSAEPKRCLPTFRARQ